MPADDEPRFRASVAAAATLSPSLRRLRFTGPELAGFTSSGDPDERVLIDFEDAADDRRHNRSYTVRAWHPGARMLDVDFAVHAGGPAAEWARTAVPGAAVRVSRPKGWYRPPVAARRLLVLADLSALPAAGRIVESVSAGVAVHVAAEVPDAADEQTWDSAADLSMTWLHGTGNGATPSALPGALPDLVAAHRPDYVWAAGETGASRTVRGYLRRTLGWAPERYHVMGYWQADRERWLARYAKVEAQMEELTARELTSGRSLEEVRDAIDDALDRAGL
ncbi:siderophore-interacting protein [Rhodococcus sp. NPDC058505]|uniref:siderophore-interacting protein n=1 Tax=unclassified Rhodococcus (in: high G+C Gram-positive bacteria) TaxID=192944 RepID=UPI003668B5AE